MTRKDYAAYQRSVAHFMKTEGLANLSTGHLKCPECEVAFETGTCPQCKKDAGSFALEPYFSGKSCDCCGSMEAGDRMDAHGYCPATKEVKEYVICTDCEYYAEYGQLPDMTMLEIQKSDREFYNFDDVEEGFDVLWRGGKATVTAKVVEGENADGKTGYVQLEKDGKTYRLYDNHVNGSDKLEVYCHGID